MRVIVCGGRDFSDSHGLHGLLSSIHRIRPISTVVHGGARGADRAAGQWARFQNVKEEEHPAEWRKNGKAAGMIRNTRMVALGADLCIVLPGGRGTNDTASKAHAARLCILDLRSYGLSSNNG
jgi:hypothetical protein